MAKASSKAFPIEWKSDIHMRVKNLAALRGNLLDIDAEMRKQSLELMRKYSGLIKAKTSRDAPKDTWFMAENVREDFTKQGFGFTVGWLASDFTSSVQANGRPRKFYPPWVEYPTRINPDARPSLGPAYEMYAPALLNEMRQLFRGVGRRTRG